MSINQLIEISRRSFRTLDAAMNTVSQNIANVNTEGYTRRRVIMQADSLALDLQDTPCTKPARP